MSKTKKGCGGGGAEVEEMRKRRGGIKHKKFKMHAIDEGLRQ